MDINNVAPELCVRVWDASKRGDFAGAFAIARDLLRCPSVTPNEGGALPARGGRPLVVLSPGFTKEAPFAVNISLYATNLMWTTSDLLFSGLLQRHPKLKVMLSEAAGLSDMSL